MVNPPNRPGSPTPSSPVGGEDVQGPESATHSSLGDVRPVYIDPFLSGKNLGLHLTGKGVKNWLLTLLKHPKSTFDLISGKLEKKRETNPTKYLEELSDLSSSKKDWQFVFDECNELKQGQSSSVKEKIEGWQSLSFAHLLNGSDTNISKTLDDALRLASTFDNPIMYDGRSSELGSAIHTLYKRISHRTQKGISLKQLNHLESQLKALDEKIHSTSGNTPLKVMLRTIEQKQENSFLSLHTKFDPTEKTTAKSWPSWKTAETKTPPTSVPENKTIASHTTPFEDDHEWVAGTKPIENSQAPELETIDESKWPDELLETYTHLKNDPDNTQQWESFKELQGAIQEELPPKAADKVIQECLNALIKAHPKNTTVVQHWNHHFLMNQIKND